LSISFHFSTYFSSIFSKSFHYSTDFSSIFSIIFPELAKQNYSWIISKHGKKKILIWKNP
jgi:hypothetical protein